jgi:hypothetical protein
MKTEVTDDGKQELQKRIDLCTFLCDYLGFSAHLLGCTESNQLSGSYFLPRDFDDPDLFCNPVLSDKKYQSIVCTHV